MTMELPTGIVRLIGNCTASYLCALDFSIHESSRMVFSSNARSGRLRIFDRAGGVIPRVWAASDLPPRGSTLTMARSQCVTAAEFGCDSESDGLVFFCAVGFFGIGKGVEQIAVLHFVEFDADDLDAFRGELVQAPGQFVGRLA